MNLERLSSRLPQAVTKDNVRKAAALLEAGADPNTRFCFGAVPLHNVASVEMVRLFAAHGANVDAKTIDGMTPLSYAVLNGRIEVARALIECGADPYGKDKKGGTAFDLAKYAPHPGQMLETLHAAWRERVIIEQRRH